MTRVGLAVHAAINRFWTGEPKEYPDLAAVHQAMGLKGNVPILNESHPLVVAANAEKPGEPFTLAYPAYHCNLQKARCLWPPLEPA